MLNCIEIFFIVHRDGDWRESIQTPELIQPQATNPKQTLTTVDRTPLKKALDIKALLRDFLSFFLDSFSTSFPVWILFLGGMIGK